MITDLDRLYLSGASTLLAAYFVWDAVRTGATFISPLLRFRRDDQPAPFWLTVGLFGLIGAAAFGWTVHYALRVA